MSESVFNVLGAGSILMGDDGIGPAAIAALARAGVPADVRLYDAGLAVSDVLGTLDPSQPLVVIDALRAGGSPGSVYQARLDGLSTSHAPLAGSLSLHELSVVPALTLEAVSGRAFCDVTVFGVEPEVIQWGRGLSPAVAGAMERLVTEVLRHIGALRREYDAVLATGDAGL